MKSLKALAVGIAMILGACTYPTSIVQQGGAQNGIYFAAAPAGARAIVDGQDKGEAMAFDGRKAILGLDTGTHKVTVILGNQTLYDREIYIGTGSRVEVRVQ